MFEKRINVVVDSMIEHEISAYCYSEKECVGIGFGVSFDSGEDSIETIGCDWINIGMSESFWENAFEFDAGIEKASMLIDENPNLTYRQALYEVFGDFQMSYTMDGKDIDFKCEIDATESMYDLLVEL